MLDDNTLMHVNELFINAIKLNTNLRTIGSVLAQCDDLQENKQVGDLSIGTFGRLCPTLIT